MVKVSLFKDVLYKLLFTLFKLEVIVLKQFSTVLNGPHVLFYCSDGPQSNTSPRQTFDDSVIYDQHAINIGLNTAATLGELWVAQMTSTYFLLVIWLDQQCIKNAKLCAISYEEHVIIIPISYTKVRANQEQATICGCKLVGRFRLSRHKQEGVCSR